MVSRMLTEARESGIVAIRIQRPLQSDPDLEIELKEKFGLKDVFVVVTSHRSGENDSPVPLEVPVRRCLPVISRLKRILGLAWGTSISATVDAFEDERADAGQSGAIGWSHGCPQHEI